MAKARRKSNEELETRLAALEALVDQVTPYITDDWNGNGSSFTGVATNFTGVEARYARIGNAVFCWGSGDITFSGNGDYTFDLSLPVAAIDAGGTFLKGLFNRTTSSITVSGNIFGTGDPVTAARFAGTNNNGAGTRGAAWMFNYFIEDPT